MFKKLQDLKLKCINLVSKSDVNFEWRGETLTGDFIVIKRTGQHLAGAIADCENRAQLDIVMLSSEVWGHVNIEWLVTFFNWTIEDEVFDPMG